MYVCSRDVQVLFHSIENLSNFILNTFKRSYYLTDFHDPTLTGASITPTPKIGTNFTFGTNKDGDLKITVLGSPLMAGRILLI